MDCKESKSDLYTCTYVYRHTCAYYANMGLVYSPCARLRSAGQELLKAGEWNEVGSFAKSYSTGGGRKAGWRQICINIWCCFVAGPAIQNNKHLPESDFSILGIPKIWYKFQKILVFVLLFCPSFFCCRRICAATAEPYVFSDRGTSKAVFGLQISRCETWAMEMLPSYMGIINYNI